MSEPILTVRLPYRVRCALPDCRKPVNLVFKQEIEGDVNSFCSPQHANLGRERWMEKKEKNIIPGRPLPPETEPMVGDNISEIEEGGENG